MELRHRRRGDRGFAYGDDILLDKALVGRVSWGGRTQGGWTSVNITAVGCHHVKDWQHAAAEVENSLTAYQLRRVDIALDLLDARGYDRVVAAHGKGQFKSGGRPPRMHTTESSDPLMARKVTVGSRTGAKFLRGYEKGKTSPASLSRRRSAGDPYFGRPDRVNWFRLELELKAVGRVHLPADLLLQRDSYFAGAYPYLAGVLRTAPALQLPRAPSAQGRLEMMELLEHIKLQYGPTIFTASMLLGPEETLRRISRQTLDVKLVEKGVFAQPHSGEVV